MACLNTGRCSSSGGKICRFIGYSDESTELKSLNDFLTEIRSIHEGIENHFDTDFYYFEFANPNSIRRYPLHKIFTDNEIDKIRKGEALLVINNSHEAFIEDMLEACWEEIIIKYDIEPKNFILITESWNLGEHAHNVAKKYNNVPFKIKNINYIETGLRLSLFNNSENYDPKKFNPQPLKFENIKKCYLNLNRRWRLHRPAVVSLLIMYNLLDKGYVSLSSTPDSLMNNNWNWFYSNNRIQDENILKLLNDNREKLCSFGELIVDKEDLTENKFEIDNTSFDFYKKTYLNLVSETFYYGNHNPDEASIFFTEKIFKPIANYQPFILVSTHNALKYFKKKGYKTFHPYIDESYDDESNDDLRMIKIVKEVERLSNFSAEEIKKFIEDCTPICIHNFNLFNSIKDFTFVDLV